MITLMLSGSMQSQNLSDISEEEEREIKKTPRASFDSIDKNITSPYSFDELSEIDNDIEDMQEDNLDLAKKNSSNKAIEEDNKDGYFKNQKILKIHPHVVR